ncbi:MAG: hypothetical protein KIS61_16695 [Candidatus Eremiobacteraeota bacterium]|nr:hypothetical protein [Candidatus Eremiobacteraeota bacterium]
MADELRTIFWAYSNDLISLENLTVLQYFLLKSAFKDRDLFQRLANSILTRTKGVEPSIVGSELEKKAVRAVVLSREVQNFESAFDDQYKSFLCEIVDQGFERGFRMYLTDSGADTPALAEFLLSPIFDITSSEENPLSEHQRIYAFRWLIIDRRLPIWDSRKAQSCKVTESQIKAIEKVTKLTRAKLSTLIARDDIEQRTSAGYCSLEYLLSISNEGSRAQTEFLDEVRREAREEIDKDSVLAATFLCIASEALDIRGLVRSLGEAAIAEANSASRPPQPTRHRERSRGKRG